MNRTDVAPSGLLAALSEAGLTGRGGAAFATARKVEAAHRHGAQLIVNACDGEIGAAKDGWVIEHHLAELVAGAQLVAPDARRIRYAAKRDSATAQRLRAAGLPVLEVPDRYVSSEETALISLAHNGLARPLTKGEPFVQGGRDSHGRRIEPSVVLNAETVWRVAQIADRGPRWFRAHGTPAEPGPRLVAISGAVPRPGVLETEAGMPLRTLLAAAGGLADGAEVIGVSGLSGILLPRAAATGMRWDSGDLGCFGGSIGPGILHVWDPARCPVEHVDDLLQYAAGQSAGQCGPCMFGLPAIAADWHALSTAQDSRAADARLERRIDLLPGRGACRFPDGIARFAASARSLLADHLAAHAAGRCPHRDRSNHAA